MDGGASSQRHGFLHSRKGEVGKDLTAGVCFSSCLRMGRGKEAVGASRTSRKNVGKLWYIEQNHTLKDHPLPSNETSSLSWSSLSIFLPFTLREHIHKDPHARPPARLRAWTNTFDEDFPLPNRNAHIKTGTRGQKGQNGYIDGIAFQRKTLDAQKIPSPSQKFWAMRRLIYSFLTILKSPFFNLWGVFFVDLPTSKTRERVREKKNMS